MNEVNFLGLWRALGQQVGGEIGHFLPLYFGQVLLSWRCWLALFGDLQRHCLVLGPRREDVAAAGLLFL